MTTDHNAVAPTTSEPNPPPAAKDGALTLLVLCGWALEWKHGLPALCEPFSDCKSPVAAIMKVGGLPDATFLGLIVWVAILLGTSAATCGLGAKYLTRLNRSIRNR